MEKVSSVIDVNYDPDSVIFFNSEIVTKTCNIYKPNLTKEQKLKRFKQTFLYEDFVNITSTDRELNRAEKDSFYNGDFYIFSVKDEFLKELESGKVNFYFCFTNKRVVYNVFGEGVETLFTKLNNVNDYFSSIQTYMEDYSKNAESSRLINKTWYLYKDGEYQYYKRQPWWIDDKDNPFTTKVVH